MEIKDLLVLRCVTLDTTIVSSVLITAVAHRWANMVLNH